MNTNISKNLRSLGVALAIGAAALGTLTIASTTAFAAEEVNVTGGVALHGYDPVAYFTVGQPTVGKTDYTAQYQGAIYQFASAENRDLFADNPAKYAPQYGGFCAFGTAMGRKFDGDPTAWRIVDGKLYLNLNKTVQARWVEDVPGFIRGANHNWQIIRPVEDAKLADAAAAPEGLTIGAQ